MNVCHVITRFIAGGAQENTLASVVGLARKGHILTLVSGPSTGPEGCLFDYYPALAGQSLFRFVEEPDLVRPILPWHDCRAYFHLKHLFETNHFDIIHTHSSKAGILARLAARSSRRSGQTLVVHTIHGLSFDSFKPFWKNTAYRSMERLCARHSDALVSVCDTMTAQALAAGVGTPSLYTTIYSGFDLQSFQTARTRRAEQCRALGIPPDTVVLVSIGRLFTMKGAEEFLSVLEYLHQSSSVSVTGIFVGDGPLRSYLEQRARKNLPPHSVMFTGLVPPTEIPDWLAVADGVVHASLREGLARVLVQALAAGVPVVTYDVGGAREVISDFYNGFVCEPGNLKQLCDAVRTLATDTKKRHALAEAARATDITQFDNAVMVSRLETLYQSLTANA